MASSKSFISLYVMQREFQQRLIDEGMYGNLGYVNLPDDRLNLFSYHMQAMISELGEVLEADKRWKNYRGGEYFRSDKLEEIVDCFLTLMNVAIFSGYTSYEVEEAMINKMMENEERLNEEIELGGQHG